MAAITRIVAKTMTAMDTKKNTTHTKKKTAKPAVHYLHEPSVDLLSLDVSLAGTILFVATEGDITANRTRGTINVGAKGDVRRWQKQGSPWLKLHQRGKA